MEDDCKSPTQEPTIKVAISRAVDVRNELSSLCDLAQDVKGAVIYGHVPTPKDGDAKCEEVPDTSAGRLIEYSEQQTHSIERLKNILEDIYRSTGVQD